MNPFMQASEDPFHTHDGSIWPLPRPAMTDAVQILKRMRQDIANIPNGMTQILDEDLLRAGWSAAQVARYGALAIAAAHLARHGVAAARA